MAVEPKPMTLHPDQRECWFSWGPEHSWLAQVWTDHYLRVWRSDGRGGYDPFPLVEEPVSIEGGGPPWQASYDEVNTWQRRIQEIVKDLPRW